jgi:hypothetical protein
MHQQLELDLHCTICIHSSRPETRQSIAPMGLFFLSRAIWSHFLGY